MDGVLDDEAWEEVPWTESFVGMFFKGDIFRLSYSRGRNSLFCPIISRDQDLTKIIAPFLYEWALFRRVKSPKEVNTYKSCIPL